MPFTHLPKNMFGLNDVRLMEPTGARSQRRMGYVPTWTVLATNDAGITFEFKVREPVAEELAEILSKGVMFLDSRAD